MKADQLKEAQAAVDTIKNIDVFLSYKLASNTQQLVVEQRDGSRSHLTINRDVAEAALKLQKEALRKRRAELVRRLNQLGVVL